MFIKEVIPVHEKEFPQNELEQTVKCWNFSNKEKLSTELGVLYGRKKFHQVSGAVQLLQVLLSNNLEETFSESVTPLRLLVTIPMTTSEHESCYSTLKRIKSFLRSTMGQERLSALAMLSTEKNMISSIANFNEKVIDIFANRRERRMDFIYK